MGGSEKDIDEDVSSVDGSTRSKDSKKNTPKAPEKAATFRETFSFALESGPKAKLLLVLGTFGGIGNGLVSRSSFRQTVVVY
jgi:hypothetical protein